jgi:uncharacterized protein YcbK (DUF882 family)
MAVKTYPKKAGVKLSDHFTSSEFDCPCDSCTETLIDERLIELLEPTRRALGAPLRINSGYRCSQYQEALRLRGYETACGISQHELGRAVDIMLSGDGEATGAEIERAARAAGFKAVGVGHNWCHVDLRDDKERRWEYKSR